MDTRYDSWPGRVERESLWLLRLALRLVRGEEHARELVQDTCVTALSRPPRNRRHPRAWLRRVMLNLVRQDARRGAVRGRPQEIGPDGAEYDESPGGLLERDEMLDVLAEELDSLEEPFQSTVKQHFLFGRTSIEIARRDAIPDGTVRWRLKRGLDRLRERLDARCGDRSAWVGAFLPLLTPFEPAASVSHPPARPLRGAPLGPLAAGIAAGVVLVGGALALARERTRVNEGADLIVAVAVDAGIHPAQASAIASDVRASMREEAALPPASGVLVEPRRHLDVTVLDEQGHPLAGAEVQVAAPGGFEPRARTDADGRADIAFAAADLGAFGAPSARGRVTLRVRAEGQAFPDVVSLDPVVLPVGQSLSLVSQGVATTIHGLVVDEDGEPVPDVDVTAFLDANHRGAPGGWGELRAPDVVGTRTDANGAFAFDGRPACPHFLSLSHPDHRITMDLIEPGADGSLKARLELRSGCRVTGRVIHPDGRPASGARIWYEPSMRGTEWAQGAPGFRLDMHGFTHVATTDADGRYELRGVPSGHRRVYAQAAEDAREVGSRLMHFSCTGAECWDVALAVTAPLRLRVTDPRGTPLAGWVLELRSRQGDEQTWRRRLETDGDGRATCFDALGRTSVCVQAPGAPEVPVRTVELDPGEREQRIVVDLDRLATLSGQVVECSGTRPDGELFLLPRAAAIPVPLEFDVRTGTFECRVEPGTYALMLGTGDKEPLGCWLGDVELVAGVASDLGVVMAPPVATLDLRIPPPPPTHGPRPSRLTVAHPGGAWRVWEAPPQSRTLLVHAGLVALTTPAPGDMFQTAWLAVDADRENVLDLEAFPGRVLVDLGPQTGRVTLTVRPDVEAEDLAPGIARSVVAWPVRAQGVHVLRLPLGDWTIEARTDAGAFGVARVSVAGPLEQTVPVDLRVR